MSSDPARSTSPQLRQVCILVTARPGLEAAIDSVIATPDMAPYELRAAFIMANLDDDMEMRLSGTLRHVFARQDWMPLLPAVTGIKSPDQRLALPSFLA